MKFPIAIIISLITAIAAAPLPADSKTELDSGKGTPLSGNVPFNVVGQPLNTPPTKPLGQPLGGEGGGGQAIKGN